MHKKCNWKSKLDPWFQPLGAVSSYSSPPPLRQWRFPFFIGIFLIRSDLISESGVKMIFTPAVQSLLVSPLWMTITDHRHLVVWRVIASRAGAEWKKLILLHLTGGSTTKEPLCWERRPQSWLACWLDWVPLISGEDCRHTQNVSVDDYRTLVHPNLFYKLLCDIYMLAFKVSYINYTYIYIFGYSIVFWECKWIFNAILFLNTSLYLTWICCDLMWSPISNV